MKIQRASHFKRGFTLMELMVAMAITTIIVTVLVSITSVAIDTWNRSRSELRAARQAKAMVDTMAADFESMVTRRGNVSEWLFAEAKSENGSTNAVDLVFFSAATDRYNGQIGVTGVDEGGDVSCVGYKLEWKDPIPGSASTDSTTFVLNRFLVDPKMTFDTLLGKPEIGSLFSSTYGQDIEKPEYFVCENVFQFTLTFNIEVTPAGTSVPENKLVTVSTSGGVEKFSIKGSGIETTPKNSILKEGRITAVGISLTVLSDSAVKVVASKGSDPVWMAKNSYQYSKLIKISSM
jgi:prepilin-type N-terminal cleavage/methylation domain-containing protein